MFPWPQVTHGTLKTWRGETFWTVWRGSIFTISVTDARVTELHMSTCGSAVYYYIVVCTGLFSRILDSVWINKELPVTVRYVRTYSARTASHGCDSSA